MLKGVATYLSEKLGSGFPVGERVNDGAPHGAYKRVMNWYVGVYFAGFTGESGNGHYSLQYSIGVDLTRVCPLIPSAVRGGKLTEDGEYFDVAGKISQLLLSGRGKIRVACNAALVGTWEEGKGAFFEQFHTVNVGKSRGAPPEWILGSSDENQPDNPINVITLTATGLKFRKLINEVLG